jgi:AraC family transcriptional regulator of adaptative response/methylated-DNA-[protein]-cysteine methyltransferase
MNHLTQLSNDYARVEQAIRFLEDNASRQPDLAEVAAHVGLSEYHFQRLFTRWAGISPKRFLQFLTKENAKALLASTSVLSAAYEAGLSSPGRLHDLLVQTEAVSPGEYKSRGAGMDIVYGFHPTPFGECLLALTGRGICFLGFVQGGERAAMLAALRRDWANASLREDLSRTGPMVEKIFAPRTGDPIPLHLRGTNFQLKVWEALLRLPPGTAASYERLAEQVGSVSSARAVGNAVGHNPVAYLIPCHRVLQKSGSFGKYRYGAARKQAILGWEMAQAEGRNSQPSNGILTKP